MILVAGITGALGSEVARQLRAQGRTVRGLVRDPRRVASDLQGCPTHVGDALKPETLKGAAEGVEAVFSCLGAPVSSKPGAGFDSFTAVDVPANLALLDEAKRAGVKRFVYVSVFHSARQQGLGYVAAHEQVVAAIKASGLGFSIVRPTGFFSALAELVDLAKKGPLPLVRGGTAKSNPIHEGDLAALCAEAVAGGPDEVPCGGPEVLSRKEMNSLAFAAVGKAEQQLAAPLWGLKLAALGAAPFHPRLAQLIQFIASLSEEDLVAPVRGTRTLGDYFRARAAQ